MRSKYFYGILFLALLAAAFALSLPFATSFAQDENDDDPDMPRAISKKAGLTKEEFKRRRARYIAQKRGLNEGKPFDPRLRERAIEEMDRQELARTITPESGALLEAWQPIGPAPIPNGQIPTGPSTPVSGRTTAIAVHPTNPDIVYVGTASGGLYRSTDGGVLWTPMLDNAASLAIGAIAIAPSQPETIYVGTGEANFTGFFGVGVYRIENASGPSPVISGPLNKNAAGTDIFSGNSVGEILVHPTDPATIFVASTVGFGGIGTFDTTLNPSANPGVYRSTNATSANPIFTQIGPLPAPNDRFSVHDMVLDPQNPNLLVANLNVSGGGIYVSTNALSASPSFTNRQTFSGGFSTTNTEFAIQRSVGAPNPTIYAATGNGGGRVLRSLDNGLTWTQQIDNDFCGGQCSYDIAIAVDPTDPNKVYLGGDPSLVFGYSSNGGTSFTHSETGLHVDSHVITVAPSQPTTIYFGSDGGIYKSTNSGLAWTVLNNSQFGATQFMGLSVHPTDPNFTIGGTQDNGTNMYRPDGTWRRVDFGDGGYSIIDQNATDTTNVRMYHTYFNVEGLQGYATVSNVNSATDNGWSFRGCGEPGTTGNGITCAGTTLFYAPLARGPGNPNTIYFGTDRLYRSTDTGITHTSASQNPITTNDPISAIGISRQNDNVRLVGLSGGGLWGTTTGSSTLTNLDPSNNVPNAFIARAVIDPNNVNIAYVTLSAFGLTNVYRTTNLNSPSPTWTAAAGSLPQVPVNAFVIDPTTPTTIFAGTDIGVYMSTNSGTTWTPFGTGLPRLPVFDMAITAGANRKLRIATHARGMFEIAMPAAGAPTISIGDVTANEGNTGNTAFTFNVTLSTASAQTVTVAYATTNGTATAGSDYTAANGSVTFNPNETTKQVTVNVTGDTVVEPTENFFVNLTNPTGGATIADNQGLGTITNDDSAPTVTPSPTPTPADGDLDQDFVSRLIGGIADGTGGQYSYVKDIVLQPDGKAVIVGEFISFASRLQRGIARLNADGSPDYAFHPRVNGDIYGVALQQDAKIVIVGSFTEVNGQTRRRVARLNADGTLDASFLDPNVSATVNEVAIQGDRIVIGGPFANIANEPSRNMGRLTSTGALDTTFASPLFITETIGTLLVDPDGRLYIGGSFILGPQGSGFIRLNENGTIDPTFLADVGSGLNHAVRLPTGHFLVGGVISGWIKRSDANGNADPSFVVSGTTFGSVNDIVVQSDGKVVVGASSGSLTRLGQNGEFDPTYVPNIPNGNVDAVAIQPNDKVFAGGNFTSVRGQTRNSLVRLNTDASLDLFPEDISLGPAISGAGVRAVITQPDGKILVAMRQITSAGGVTRSHLVRINVDGKVDPTFNDPGISNFTSYGVTAVAVQPVDGKILIGGDFQLVGGNPRRLIARLHPNGALDTSFNASIETGGSNYIASIAVQNDNRIMIGGTFGAVEGQVRNRMARLNANGSLDASFDRGFQTCIPETIDILADGKMLACGSANNSSGLARYNSNGTIDGAFTIANTAGTNLTRSFRDPNGKIFIIGSFSTVAGFPRQSIARLNADGTLDTSFQELLFQSGQGSTIADAAVQTNGKVIIGGIFLSLNGQAYKGLARLNTDGTLDPTFKPLVNIEWGDSGQVYDVQIQADGRVLIGGDFKSVNRVGADYVARLYNGFTPGCSFAVNPTDRTFSQAAATSSVNVIAGNGCDWTALAFPNWITITSGSSGSGNGTINYTVATNTTGLPRTGTIDVAGLAGAAVHTITQQGSNPTPSPTPTVGPSPTPTVGPSPTPTVAPSPTPTPGNVIINYTGPAVTIPDNVAGGVNVVTNVATACTITDMNFRFDGTPSADPASTTVGLSHSWIGDLIIKLTSPAGTTVTMIDRPGVPALNSSGCNSNNLAQVTIDDDGGFPAIENQCGSDDNAAFPSGTFSPNNPLSAFDGQSTAGNWTLNVSDNAGQDTGSIRAFTLIFSCPASNPTPTPSPTRTPTPTPTPTPVATPTPTPTPPACSFAANPTSRSIPAAGGTSSFAIVTPAGCGWTASAGASWVTLTSPSSGTGPTTLNYTITANSDISPRTTTIDFGGVGGIAEHTITQAGNAASPSPTPTVAPSPTPTATPIVRDGGYEMTSAVAGTNPHWTSTSTAFGSSLCFGTSVCGSGTAPRSGSGWVWFDGTGSGAAAEAGTAVQSVTMAAGSTAILTFYMRVASVSAPSSSTMTVTIDGTVVQTFTEPATAEAAYSLRTVDLSAFANGQPRQLSLNYNRPGGTTGSDNFLLDDVTLTATAQPFATVTGRVLTPTGTALRNAPVSMINPEGVRVVATTSSFGVYTFNNVATGRTYTMTVSSKRYRFSPRTMDVSGNLSGVDFVGLE